MKYQRVVSILLAAAMAAVLCVPAAAAGETGAERLVGKVVKIDCPTYSAACDVTYTYDYETMTMTVTSENVLGNGGYFDVGGMDTDAPFGGGVSCSGRFETDEVGRITYEQAANVMPMQFFLIDYEVFIPAPALVYAAAYSDDQGQTMLVGCATEYDENGAVTAQRFEMADEILTLRFDEYGMPVSAGAEEPYFSYAYTPVYTGEDGTALVMRVDGDGEASEVHTGFAQYFDGNGRLTRANAMEMELARQYWENGALRHVTAQVLDYTYMYPLVNWSCNYDELGRPLFSELAFLGDEGERATQATTYFYGAPDETLEDVMAREGGPRNASGARYVDMEQYKNASYVELEEGDPGLDALVAQCQQQLDDCFAAYNRVCDGDIPALLSVMPYQALASLAIEAGITVEEMRALFVDEVADEYDELPKEVSCRVTAASQSGSESFSLIVPPDDAWELEVDIEYEDGTTDSTTVFFMNYNGVWSICPI